MSRFSSTARGVWILVLLTLALALAAVAPSERTLGTRIRTVYLHGAWVWAALLSLAAAAGIGLAALVARRPRWHAWSRAWGRTGVLLWILYLPLSLWAMQTNWNGLFLAEPRWRLGVMYAVVGLLLQLGLSLLPLVWASVGNLAYFLALVWSLTHTPRVLHPPAPAFHAGALTIRLTFLGLTLLLTLMAWQITLLWTQIEPRLRGG